MENKKSNKLLKILFILIIIVIILVIIFLKTSNKSIQDDITNIELENLDINNELVQNLYSKILKCNKTAIDFEGSFYKDEKTTINELTDKEKSIAIIQNLEEKLNSNFEDLDKEIQTKILERVENHYERDIKLSEGYEYVHDLKIYTEEELNQKIIELFGDDVKINFENLDNGMDSYWEYIDGRYYSFYGMRRWRIWSYY